MGGVRLQLLGAALSCLWLLFETMLPALALLPCWHACCWCWLLPALLLAMPCICLVPCCPCCSAERATVLHGN